MGQPRNAAAASDPHGLYNANMAMAGEEGCGIIRNGADGGYTYSLLSGRANKPVKWVSFWSACRFVNWLHNGQGNGDTETGAYTLTPDGIANNTITRNAGWKFAVTSEDEWYKAAYHKNDGPTGNYWDYPTGSDTPPTAEVPPGTDRVKGSANYDGGWGDIEETDVGAYTAKPSSSPYGTFDQGGNAWEWNETALTWEEYLLRGIRGGEASSNVGEDAPGISSLHAMMRNVAIAAREFNDVGFRVVKSMAGVVVFEDDFSDGVSDGWKQVLGTWVVAGQTYRGVAEDHNNDMLTVTGDPSWTSYVFSARVMLMPTDSGFNDFGLVFYAQKNEYLRFTLGAEDAPPTAKITHCVYDAVADEYFGVAALATVVSEPEMVSGRWYNVSLVLDHDRVSAFVDGDLVAYADNLPFSKGYIGLSADAPTVVFDDIVVTIPDVNDSNNAASWLPMFGGDPMCQDDALDLYLYDMRSGDFRTIHRNCNKTSFGSMNKSSSQMVFAETSVNEDRAWIKLYDVATDSTMTIHTMTFMEDWPTAFFDSNNMIVFDGADGEIKRMDTDGQNIVPVAKPVDTYRLGRFWMSPDRHKLVVIEGQPGWDYETSNYERLVLFNADGSGRRVLVERYLGEWNFVVWKPDSSGFIYYYHTFNGEPLPYHTEEPHYITFDLSKDPIDCKDLSGSDLGSKDENVCFYTRSGNLLNPVTGERYDPQTGSLLPGRCPDVLDSFDAGIIGVDQTGGIYFADPNGENFREVVEFPVPTQQVEASGTIGPLGGTVEVTDPTSPLYGVRIDIPAGALYEETTITISRGQRVPPFLAEMDEVPLVVDIGPSGTQFHIPARVWLPCDASARPRSVCMFASDDQETWEYLSSGWFDAETNHVTCFVSHLTAFTRGGLPKLQPGTYSFYVDTNFSQISPGNDPGKAERVIVDAILNGTFAQFLRCVDVTFQQTTTMSGANLLVLFDSIPDQPDTTGTLRHGPSGYYYYPTQFRLPTIKINARSVTEHWYTYWLDPSQNVPHTAVDLYSLIVHEVSHFLGFCAQKDVMYDPDGVFDDEFTPGDGPARQLKQDDIDLIKLTYPFVFRDPAPIGMVASGDVIISVTAVSPCGYDAIDRETIKMSVTPRGWPPQAAFKPQLTNLSPTGQDRYPIEVKATREAHYPPGQYTVRVAAFPKAADGDAVAYSWDFTVAGDEICGDGIDNDGDGQIDEEGATGCTTYYKDNDGDGYGQTNDKKCLCSPTAPYTAVKSGDCDDSNPSIHPGATEICGDGIDQDCDGRDTPCEPPSQSMGMWWFDFRGDQCIFSLVYVGGELYKSGAALSYDHDRALTGVLMGNRWSGQTNYTDPPIEFTGTFTGGFPYDRFYGTFEYTVGYQTCTGSVTGGRGSGP
jgi:hypothetical protein